MAAATPDKSSLKAALDANVHEGLQLATGALAALLVFFAVVDMLVTPAQHATRVALADLASAALFFGVHMAYRRGQIGPGRAHLVGAILAAVVSVSTLHDAYLLADPEQTAYLVIVALGVGSMFLNKRATYVVLGVTFGGFLVVASAHPAVNWTTFGLALFAACVLALIVHAIRYNTFVRLEALRIEEVGRKEQLQIRESALESAVEALQESEERYRRLVEGAPDAFLVHSAGRIVYANTAAIRMLGAGSAADLLGREVIRFVRPDQHEAFLRGSALVEKEGRATDSMEMTFLRLDGSPVDVDAVGQPITYMGRPADQTVLRDITDRKRAESERHVASQRLAEISRLKEMDRVKTQFVNTISHELRTPLTPIKVQIHILKGAKDAASASKATDMIERNVQRLSALVDELLEVARIQAGTLKLSKSYVELGSTISHALDSYLDVARAQGIEIHAKIEPGLTVQGDARRLQQVLYNLLGNAFKFTEPGGRVYVEVQRDGGDALVSVRDTGAGIAPNDVPRLFEPFSQVHDTMEKTNAGTGLGLYICRGIVEGHGGRIWAESEGKGKGARFAFRIPLSPPA